MRESDIRPKALFERFLALMQVDAERLAAQRERFVPVTCRACGAEERTFAFEKDGFPYVTCAACGTLFVSPRPTDAALAEWATSSEAIAFWSTHFYRETAAARREKMFRPRAELLVDLMRRGMFPPDPVVADIGAGYGLFLVELRATGAFRRVVGIEPDARLAAVCRGEGFPVIEERIEDVRDGEVGADVATAFEVIEHVFDPAEFVRGCARALRPGGVLLFTTLTISGFDLLTLWDRSRSITPPQHINFPTLEGMRRLVARSGLELVELATPGKLDVDIVRNASLSDPSLRLPRFIEQLVRADERVRGEFQTVLSANGMSSHLRCIARRPSSP